MSKGSVRRPAQVPAECFSENWRRTFGQRIRRPRGGDHDAVQEQEDQEQERDEAVTRDG